MRLSQINMWLSAINFCLSIILAIKVNPCILVPAYIWLLSALILLGFDYKKIVGRLL